MLCVSYVSIKLKEKEETAVELRKSLRKERVKEYSSNQIIKLSTSKKKKYRIIGTSLVSVTGHISMPFLKITIQAEHQNENKVYQFSSVTQSCPTLWDPMDRSTPGLPVHHQLLEFTQTHVH